MRIVPFSNASGNLLTFISLKKNETLAIFQLDMV